VPSCSATSSPEEERICIEFIEAFRAGHDAAAIERGVIDLAENFLAAMTDTKEKYEQVWMNVTMMEKVVSRLLCIGTMHILEGNSEGARCVAYYATYLEQVAGAFHKKYAIMNCSKVLEKLEADEHTVVRFFQRRIPCSCLDEKYKEVKSITKMGICCNPECSYPGRKVARSKMLYCTRCCAVNYCSSECQAADWPSHRECCNSLVAMKAEFDTKE
jgi:hypothetical protein